MVTCRFLSSECPLRSSNFRSSFPVPVPNVPVPSSRPLGISVAGHGFHDMSFSPSQSGGVVPFPVIVRAALPGVLCGCRVDSATGTGMFPIVGVCNPALSQGARGAILGLSSSLHLRLATSGIFSKVSPLNTYIRPVTSSTTKTFPP